MALTSCSIPFCDKSWEITEKQKVATQQRIWWVEPNFLRITQEVRWTDQFDYLNKLGWLGMLHSVKAKIMKMHFQCCFVIIWQFMETKAAKDEERWKVTWTYRWVPSWHSFIVFYSNPFSLNRADGRARPDKDISNFVLPQKGKYAATVTHFCLP